MLSSTLRAFEDDRWFTLDNAASFMPPLSGAVSGIAFRISATLGDDVYLPALADAMDALSRRFDYFNVELRRGLFWYYLEPIRDRTPVPAQDSRYPCLNMSAQRAGRFLFRVRVFRSRIAVEFCHVLTDGWGALTYLRTLLVEYHRRLGLDVGAGDDIPAVASDRDPEECEDAYRRYYRPGLPRPGRASPAFKPRMARLAPGLYRVTTGIAPLSVALAAAKARQATLTELMAAVYLASLQELYQSLPPRRRRSSRPILAVEVPVNLRRFFPSKTMRNFVLLALVTVDARHGPYDLDDLLARTRTVLRTETTADSLASQISSNVAGERHPIVRLLPLPLKIVAAALVHRFIIESTISGSVSNLGAVGLPSGLGSRVLRFDFIPGPRSLCRSNVNMISWQDTLSLSFGSLAAEPALERLFFSRLVRLGIPIRVESNIGAQAGNRQSHPSDDRPEALESQWDDLSRKRAWELYGVCSAIAGAIALAADYLGDQRITWSPYPVSALAYLSSALFAVAQRKRRPRLAFAAFAAATLAFLLALDAIAPPVSWFPRLGLPIAGMALAGAAGLAAIIARQRATGRRPAPPGPRPRRRSDR